MTLLKMVEEARSQVNEMINAAEKQGVRNFGPLYNLQRELNALYNIIINNKDLNLDFIENWKNLWQWIPRFFDGDPFLKLLNQIDEQLRVYIKSESKSF